MRRTSIWIVMALLVAATAAAQTSTTGSVVGTVSDGSGEPLPGATVVATSDSLVAGSATAVAGSTGNFRFPSLPPGTYAFEASLPGFQSVRQEAVRVRLGGVLEIDFLLSDQTLSEEVLVVAEAVEVSTVSNTVSTNLDETFLERQPLPRDTTALINYAPGINSGSAYGSPNSQANAYNLDGVDVSDPASGQQWILPNMNWIEEVQVLGLGADAEYGSFTGAVVNLVTKSGGNELTGDVALYYTDDSLNSENAPEGSEGVETLDQDWEISFGLGGKLLRDRLWYFVSGEERERTIEPFFVADAVGVPADELGQYERSYSRYLGKLTWQPDPANRLWGLVDYDGVETANRGIGDFVLASGASFQDSPNWAYNATWESLIDDDNFLTAKITGFDGTDDRLPSAGSDVPGRDDFFNSGLLWTNYTWTWLTDKQRLNAEASWNLFADDVLGLDEGHVWKFGVVWESSEQDEVRTRNGGFTYVDDSYYCDSVDDYFADPSCGLFSSDRGNEIDFHAEQEGLHVYAQDSLRLDRWTINAGVRWTDYTGGFADGGDVYETDMIAPRLGVAWDVLGDGSTALKAHVGRYYEGLLAFMYDREISGDVFTPLEFWDWDFGANDWVFYSDRPTGGAVMDPGIDHPYVDQYVLTFERELGDLSMIGVDLIHREYDDMIAMVNTTDAYDLLEAPLSADSPDFLDGPLPFYELLDEQAFLLTNPADATREYDAVTLRYHRRHRDWWSVRASVVWTDLEGNTDDIDGYEDAWEDLNGQINNLGRPSGFSEWEGKVNLSIDLPWELVASTYYLYRSGAYWTPYVTVAGLLENNRTTVNLLDRGSFQLDDRHLVDLHLERPFDLGGVELAAMVDVFNLFDSDTVTDVSERWGTYDYVWDAHPEESVWDPRPGFGAPTAIEDPREIRLGLKVRF